MSNISILARRVRVGLLLIFALGSPRAVLPMRADNLSPEELISKHLESIGAAEARTSVSTSIALGAMDATYRARGVNRAKGRGLLASEGEKMLLGMTFETTGYAPEQFGYDGKRLTVYEQTAGVRSTLGAFLLTHDIVFKQGLLGGVLTSAWALRTRAAHDPRLEYAGLRKVGNQSLHELKYYPRGGSDLQISMFFEPETFRHVRTEYKRVISGRMGSSPDLSARSRETRYKLTEEFADFKKVQNGLTLPHEYKLKLVIEGQTDALDYEWDMRFSQFVFNQPIDPKSFVLVAK